MIVLTGGAGFIGSCLLSVLNQQGITDVLVVDSLGTGSKWKNLLGKSYVDLVSKELFREMMHAPSDAMGEISAVIHMGACSSTTERDADYLFDNNFRYSVEVAEFAMQHNARFIYASSAATYGDGDNGYSDGEFTLRPLNMYGYSKLLFDQWIIEEGLDTKCVGLKFFNVFGPNEYHKESMASMVYKSTLQIRATGKVSLFKSNSSEYADGGQMRDFVYVKDACRTIMQLLEDDTINGVFNLGTGIASSWNDMAAAVFNALGVPPKIEYIDMPAELSHQYQNFTQAEMSKLQKALPELRFGDLNSTIADYVTEHLSSKWMYW
ncbi:MAG: ADP-glyceromanno-heptose 6-epimerase [Ignavibacteria bacterium]|nr:ADP-glyceromanno-heptose 6-epimerase [Ignavibacteria bacterium]